jgi:hypothetical protein
LQLVGLQVVEVVGAAVLEVEVEVLVGAGIQL